MRFSRHLTIVLSTLAVLGSLAIAPTALADGGYRRARSDHRSHAREEARLRHRVSHLKEQVREDNHYIRHQQASHHSYPVYRSYPSHSYYGYRSYYQRRSYYPSHHDSHCGIGFSFRF